MSEEEKDQIINLLRGGLMTDGGHHKQWFLYEILKLVDPDVAKYVTDDKGIAP